MKRNLTLLIIFLGIIVFGQETQEMVLGSSTNQEVPIENFGSMLQREFNPQNVDCTSGSQKTMISFILGKDGKITDIETKSDNPSLDQEVMRAIKSIKVKFLPNTDDKGKPINSNFKQPFGMSCE